MKPQSTELTSINYSSLQQSTILIFLLILFSILDFMLPLGVAAGVPFVIVVLAAYWHPNPKSVVYIAIICSLLVLLGFFLSPQGGELWKVIINRAIAIIVILITAVLIVKIKKYLKQANIAQKQAETSNKAKSIFLSSMSHELRTPMNAIIGFGQLLEMKLEGKQKRNIQEIMNASTHLMKLIDEVLDLSGIESGEIEFHIEDHSLHQILHESLIMMESIAEEKNIKIVDQISNNNDHKIKVDGMRFKQIIINFLSNAIKYNKNDGKITLSSNLTASNQLRISVTDTGKGLTEEQISNIFKPFNRAGMENSNISGTGIGLVICKQLAEKMNCTIGVISQPDSGSTFWLDINLSNNDK